MRANRTPLILGSLLALSIFALVGCAGSSGAASAPNLGPVGVGAAYGGGPSAAPSAANGPDQNPTGEQNGPDQVGQLVDDAKIVRTGTIDLQVKDVPTALTAARNGVRAMGGYIGASQTQSMGDSPVASVTYRIPVDRWEDALDLLRGLTGDGGKVVSENTNAVEVTGAVVDLEARIKNLQASEAALQAISARATRISDVLEVEGQLTTVRGQIEELSAQLKQLNDQASYATLTASFATPVVAVQAATERWEPGKIVDQATASLVDILQGLTTAGIWFGIVWLPVLLFVGVITGVTIFILRRLGIRGGRRQGDAAAAG
jgi:hypothetical protein